MKKSKAVTIDGHLIQIDSDGMIFRLNGNGIWEQITNVDLYTLVEDEEAKWEAECDHQQRVDLGLHDDDLERSGYYD